jgi:gluconate kinase
MKEVMVQGQVAVYEGAGVGETNVVPVDAGGSVDEVVQECLGALEGAGL